MGEDSTVFAASGSAAPAATESERRQRPAALVVVSGELAGTLFDLDAATLVVGRAVEADIRLPVAGVSRRHLLVDVAGDHIQVRDAGSKNGSFLNDACIDAPVPLQAGDLLRLGPVVLKYLPRGDPERLAFDRLNQKSRLDRFTGCLNKAWFSEQLDHAVQRALATDAALSLVVFDLDHFKAINDRFGHDAGDHVLKELAALVHARGVRKGDLLARWGGEEFALLLPDTPGPAALEIAERLRHAVQEHRFEYDGTRLPVTLSAGVARLARSIEDGAALFRCADAALYQAKHRGRNRTVGYTEGQ